jgi:hypothetical protein
MIQDWTSFQDVLQAYTLLWHTFFFDIFFSAIAIGFDAISEASLDYVAHSKFW